MSDRLREALAALDLDTDALQARVEEVLAREVTWVPVRHHSPAAAAQVRALIRARRPKLVLIEGPAQANHVIPHLVDTKTKPPVAIYCSYRDDDDVLGLAGIASPSPDVPARFSSWFPLLDYSPELVAIREAKAVGAEVAFMDLPFAARLSQEGQQEDLPGWEQAAVSSELYRQLVASSGYRSWNETWDSLFEAGLEESVEDFRRRLALFCAAIRATVPPDELEADGTLARERFMAQTLRRELSERGCAEGEVLVVCGGFHLFLDLADETPPPPVPAGTQQSTLTPYSYFRVSELSGYSAGNRAPRFYQTCWERLEEPGEALLQHSVAVLRQARRHGEGLSAADAIAVNHHTRLLATLRSRPNPILDDLEDALRTCCLKGAPGDSGEGLLRAMSSVAVGTKVGKVTSAVGRLPIVRDFYERLAALELEEVALQEARVDLALDTRESLPREQAVFLRRLEWLKVGLARREHQGGLGGAMFQERWILRWSPKIEPALIELNLYGDTVEAAALGRLGEELAKAGQDAARACALLRDAIDLELPNLAQRVEDACVLAIDEDGRLTGLGEAFVHLRVVERVAHHRGASATLARLPALLERCFDRACFAIGDAARAPDEEHEGVISALRALAEAVLSEGDYERDLLVEHLRSAAEETSVPRLRGVFLGTLAELRASTPEELAREVAAQALLPQDRLIEAGQLLEGILAASPSSILLGGAEIVSAVDELLSAAEWETFLGMLPTLRAGFEHLHPAQRDSFAASVAARYGLGEGRDLSAPLATSLGAAAAIATADARTEQILQAWGLQ